MTRRSPLLKILVVNWLDRSNPQSGGAERHLHEVFGRLVHRGHDVTVVSSGFPGCSPRDTLDGMKVHRIGTRMTFSLRLPGYLKRHLRPDVFDVVVEDLNKVPVFMPFWTRAPVVLLVHHLFGTTAFHEASPPVAAATWLLERPIPRVFESVPTVTVSQSTAEDLRARGMTETRIEVVPNGVDLDRFRPGEGRFQEPTILYLGRLKRYKGVDLLLRAAAHLKKIGTPVRLLIAGKGSYLQKLKRLHGRLGLGDSVEFLGYVREEDKVRLLQQSWIHVLTSPKEGWGISILEAGACCTPTVASRSPGLQDAVIDGETGLLVPHGDVLEFSKALTRLLGNKQAREDMGLSARAFAEKFTWEASARKMETFLQARVAAARFET